MRVPKVTLTSHVNDGPPAETGEGRNSLSRIVAANDIRNILQITSSKGGEITNAIVRGILANPGKPQMYCIEASKPRYEDLTGTYAKHDFVHFYNMLSVSPSDFPSPERVEAFCNSRQAPLDHNSVMEILRKLVADVEFVRSSGIPSSGIEFVRRQHSIVDFDLVLIDDSQFTADAELQRLQGAKIIILHGAPIYRISHVREQLLSDPSYAMVLESKAPTNGLSIFRRKDCDFTLPSEEGLPIHFFTIVLNGEPFIRYHEDIFSQLIVPWHWHIVEGVASLTHDTGWSIAAGGHIPKSFHNEGRSNDGTTQYLDDLARRMPNQVTLYRQPPGSFWDGKRAMCNAPLTSINAECLLWQIDADELWQLEQIYAVHRLFSDNPSKSAASYWCDYFVGPDKVISTRYNYAENPEYEWRRTWRFQPGDRWAAHEPPILVRSVLVPDFERRLAV